MQLTVPEAAPLLQSPENTDYKWNCGPGLSASADSLIAVATLAAAENQPWI